MEQLLGFGATTQAVARYLEHKGQPYAWCLHKSEWQQHLSMSYPKAIWCFSPKLEGAHYTIVSPGIPPQHAWLQDLPADRLQTDWEAFVRYGLLRERPVVAITGTNGKSTLVSQVVHLLQKHGVDARAVGNIGRSAFQERDAEVFVLELSSAQLHYMQSATFAAVAITNIAEDHLDWHGSLAHYQAAKRKIRCFAHWVAQPGPNQAIALAEYMLDRSIDPQDLDDFQPLEHRLQAISVAKPWLVYNDSKSTTFVSSLYAIHTLRQRHPEWPLYLITAGRLKSAIDPNWCQALADVDTVMACGESATDLQKAVATIQVCDHLSQALRELSTCPPGVVLFSPVGSSFDQFRNYQERGEHFVAEVKLALGT